MNKIRTLYKSEIRVNEKEKPSKGADLVIGTQDEYENGKQNCWQLTAMDVRRLRKQLTGAEFKLFGRID